MYIVFVIYIIYLFFFKKLFHYTLSTSLQHFLFNTVTKKKKALSVRIIINYLQKLPANYNFNNHISYGY